ncbi:MAG: RidA family protein [Alphaproteobacteria bacterium]
MGRIEARLKELGLQLPEDRLVPRANAVHWRRSGRTVYVSGQGPFWGGKFVLLGRVGKDLTVEQGKEAARIAALNILAHLKDACGGDLDRVTACLMLQAFVRCTDDCNDTPIVVNGASDLIVAVLGEAGRHARYAIGCNALPRDIPVEIGGVFETAE